MKKCTRIMVSFVLTICLLLSGLPSTALGTVIEHDELLTNPVTDTATSAMLAVPEENTTVTGTSSSGDVSIICEELSLRNEYEKHFLMSDGSYQVALYNEPVHQLKEGEWVEIDNTLSLRAATDGTGWYTTANGLVNVSFSQDFDDQLVMIRQGDYAVSWGIQAVSDSLTTMTSISAELAQPAQVELVSVDLSALGTEEQMTLATKSSSAVQYRNALRQNVDLEYIVLPSRVKENIILQSPQDISYYVVTVYTENLSACLLENRQIEFYNDDDEVIFTMAAPYMYDSAGEVSEDVSIEMASKGNGCYLLKMTPDAQWLNEKSRVYPVVIDPQISTDTTQQNIVDNYVLEGSGVQNNNLDRLYIGNKSGSVARAYIKFATMPTLPSGATITAATMTVQLLAGTSTAYNASAYKVTGGDWASGTITWDNKPAAATALATNISHNNKTSYTFSCKTAVQSWYSGSTTGKNANYGIMLRYYDETIADYNSVYSADCTDESKRPVMTISYQPPTNAASVLVGATYTLSAPSVSGLLTWTSSDTSVATVNSSGKVTGVKAGKAIISVSVGGVVQQSYNVYVRIPNGVYYIKNSSVNLYMGTMGGTIADTETVLLPKSSAGPAQLRQIWKITYLDMGYYSIRPMYKLDMALGQNGSTVALDAIGSTDSYTAVPFTNYWTITCGTSGYAIKYNGSNGLAAKPGDDPAVSGSGIVIGAYLSSAPGCHWELSKLNNPPAGASLYDTINNITVTNPSKYLSVGSTKSLLALDLCAAAYSDTTNSQTFYWYSSKNTVATVDSSTGAVTGVSPGIAVITGRVSRGGSYHYVQFGICVGFPTLFNTLIDAGYIHYELCDATDDGLFLSTVSLSEILNASGVYFLPENEENTASREVALYYDDWYLYAVNDGTEVSYGLYKMREQEYDSYDNNDPGVTISFVSINRVTLTLCLSSPTQNNRHNLLLAIDKVTGPGVYDHDDVLATYFSNVSSSGSYLIAEKYIALIVDTARNGIIALPTQCIEIINRVNEIDALLDDPLLGEERTELLAERSELVRIPNKLERINTAAGYAIYSSENLNITITNPESLTLLEKQAILSCFNANETFNSFAAEVQFHAAALNDWKANFPSWYEAALRADMAIGEEYESGLYDEYYDLSSDIVQAQIAEHGEY